jgi:peptidyl-prolyl cis-trans isomerase SurA
MRIRNLLLLFFPLIALYSCAPEHSQIVVAEFGNNKVYMNEFENAYIKNSGGIEKAKKDSLKKYENFLDLLVNYKMKLRDAFDRGLPSNPEIKKELKDYKINVGTTLYMENVLYGPNIKDLYEKRKTEFRISQIVLSEDSTMNAKQVKALGNEIIARIQKGESFESMAKKYSKDNLTKNIGGDVGFYTAGEINNPEIEDAIYSTEPGNIYPHFIKSEFGYHLFKVTEKQPRKIALRLSHILVRYVDSLKIVDTLKAYKKIQGIEQQLKNGADFAELAKKYSDDKTSGKKGGDLGFIERRRTIKDFEEAAFKLGKNEISPIIKTRIGFHIIKCFGEAKPIAFDEQKEELKNIYKHTRFQNDYDNLIGKLKIELKYSKNDEVLNKILATGDTIKTLNDYLKSNLKKELGDKTIFTINGNPYCTDSLFEFMISSGNYTMKKIDPKLLNDGFDKYSSDMIIKEKVLIYDQENPEFADLLIEYENGTYLFKIIDQEVWAKLKIDSTKLQEIYNNNKENYKTKDQVVYQEIHCQKDSVIDKCYSLAMSKFNFDTLYAKYNERKGNGTKTVSDLVDYDFNEQSKQAFQLKNIGDISKPFYIDAAWSIVKLIKKSPIRIKNFDEAKSEVTSIFQEQETKRLENEYIIQLKKEYEPKLYYNELTKAFKQTN